jgi:hypothetical protein
LQGPSPCKKFLYEGKKMGALQKKCQLKNEPYNMKGYNWKWKVDTFIYNIICLVAMVGYVRVSLLW